jgi:16S rRNA (cytosine1402-N4)-methyltransferase
MQGIESVDGILLDLGVSSYQIDEADRGFSYMQDGPLDMRMDKQSAVDAAQIVNTWSVEALADVFRKYGEERRAYRIAQNLVAVRPVETTRALAEIVRRCVPERDQIKTLSKVFQALRIVVNKEIEELERALSEGLALLNTGGRMAVISYHSLEDRPVKRFFRYGNFTGTAERDFYGNLNTPWRLVTRKPVEADPSEKTANPRARSARLRIAEKL